MCKRSVARFNDNKRRCKTDTESQYTQGPLDANFGQHRAFPLAPTDEEDTSVYAYLAAVRQEAEKDSPVHFVNREITPLVPLRSQATTGLPQEYVASVIKRLEQEKDANRPILLANIEVDADTLEEHLIDGANGNEESIDAESASEILVPQSASEWRTLVFSQSPPSMTFFTSSLEHPTIIKLIVYYTKWLLVSMPPTLAEWIFVTFVRLDNGLDYTELSLVRDLGRKARKLREKFVNGKKEGLEIPEVAQNTVDMILAVVGVYYGQRDLLIEEE